jgi:hypothetical protein
MERIHWVATSGQPNSQAQMGMVFRRISVHSWFTNSLGAESKPSFGLNPHTTWSQYIYKIFVTSCNIPQISKIDRSSSRERPPDLVDNELFLHHCLVTCPCHCWQEGYVCECQIHFCPRSTHLGRCWEPHSIACLWTQRQGQRGRISLFTFYFEALSTSIDHNGQFQPAHQAVQRPSLSHRQALCRRL